MPIKPLNKKNDHREHSN